METTKPELKGEYFIDSLSDDTFEGSSFNEDDYGVFFTGSKELGIEGHCYFYGSIDDATEFMERKNTHLKSNGYL